MFDKVLIANRGEIAVRIVRACRELGIATVAVYSDADEDGLAVSLADEAVRIGPAAAPASYLNIPNVIGAALKTGADAVHPGYGLLSEDPYFAEICADHDLTFIGPSPSVMEAVGDKAVARQAMTTAGLSLLPGTVDPVHTFDEANDVAEQIGYPVVIKASAGGGGRGITVVRRPDDLREAYRKTRATAQAVFRNRDVYLERYLDRARHVEVQVLADAHGNAVHLGERDCSVQRRHQKLVEEAPSPGVSPQLRDELGKAALTGATGVGYRGAGTMEFLLDDDGRFWFMEMNARVQVEHPVTEMVTGIDIIAEQIRVAAGQPLSFTQDDVALDGHAVEFRINAEDPARDFAPTPGLLDVFHPPGGPWTRIDTACRQGDRIPPHYDSMIAKLIVWGPDRPVALDRAARALDEFVIAGGGVHTTTGFHRAVVDHPEFRSGDVRTDFLTRHPPEELT